MILAGLYARLVYLSRAPLRRLADGDECTELLRSSGATARDVARVRGDRGLVGLLGAYPQTEPVVQVLVGRRCHRHAAKGSTVRLWSSSLPGGTVCRVGEGPGQGLLVVSPELYLLLRAAELPRWELVLLAMEFWGRFDSREDEGGGIAKRPYPLASPGSVGGVVEALEGRVPGTGSVRAALAHGLPGSRSPRESAMALFLSLPRRLGGMGLGPVELNVPVGLSPQGRRILGADNAMPDLLFPSASLDVEYDSSAHHLGPEEVLRDKNRQLALQASGVEVMPVTGSVAGEYGSLVAAAEAVAARVEGREPAPLWEGLEQKRRELYEELFRVRTLW